MSAATSAGYCFCSCLCCSLAPLSSGAGKRREGVFPRHGGAIHFGWLAALSLLPFRAWTPTSAYPLLFCSSALIAGATYLFGDNHGVRLVNAEKQAGHPVDTKPLALETRFHDVEGGQRLREDAPGVPDRLSSPQLVAPAEPHSSRRPCWVICSSQAICQAGLGPDKVRNRLFAISGVSGRSVGAVMITAAFAETRTAQHSPAIPPQHPCGGEQAK